MMKSVHTKIELEQGEFFIFSRSYFYHDDHESVE